MENSIIVKTEYLRRGDLLCACVRVKERTDASAELCGKNYPDMRNSREPFDFRTHMFAFPASELEREGGFLLTLKNRAKTATGFFSAPGEEIKVKADFDPSAEIPLAEAISRTDRGLKLSSLTGGSVADGVRWSNGVYTTGGGLPVRVWTLCTDPEKVSVFAGTPNRNLEFRAGEIQTVMEEAECFASEGFTVLGAVNADFFDMFGDCHPSGLCVSRGRTVANPDSENPFFGITKEGKAVISTLDETPAENLSEAVGGGQIILSDGMINDTAPLEPFGDICHPRTAVGIREDGKLLFTVVDGRRPEWSNGASLTELAGLMKEAGATRAINLDGGGSSTFIVRNDGALRMMNAPADLQRPTENLIRPVFDSLVIVKK